MNKIILTQEILKNNLNYDFDTAELASAKYNEFAKNTHDQFYLSGRL
jgi:hypothetical protein